MQAAACMVGGGGHGLDLVRDLLALVLESFSAVTGGWMSSHFDLACCFVHAGRGCQGSAGAIKRTLESETIPYVIYIILYCHFVTGKTWMSSCVGGRLCISTSSGEEDEGGVATLSVATTEHLLPGWWPPSS